MDYRNFAHSSLNNITEIDISDTSASMAHGCQPEVVALASSAAQRCLIPTVALQFCPAETSRRPIVL
jgi:hypothetical protein